MRKLREALSGIETVQFEEQPSVIQQSKLAKAERNGALGFSAGIAFTSLGVERSFNALAGMVSNEMVQSTIENIGDGYGLCLAGLAAAVAYKGIKKQHQGN